MAVMLLSFTLACVLFYCSVGEAIRCNYCESYVSFEDCDKRLKHVECAKEFGLDHCMKTHIKASSRTDEKFKRGCQSARKCNKPPCKAPGDDKCDVFCCTEDNCNKSSITVDSGATLFICAMLATILIRLTE